MVSSLSLYFTGAGFGSWLGNRISWLNVILLRSS